MLQKNGNTLGTINHANDLHDNLFVLPISFSIFKIPFKTFSTTKIVDTSIQQLKKKPPLKPTAGFLYMLEILSTFPKFLLILEIQFIRLNFRLPTFVPIEK